MKGLSFQIMCTLIWWHMADESAETPTVHPNFDFYFVLQTAASDISNQHETKQWKYTIRWWWTMAWEENNNFVVVCIIGPFSIVFLAEIGIPGRLFEFVSSIAHTWSKYSVGFFSVIWRMVSKKVVFEFGSYVLRFPNSLAEYIPAGKYVFAFGKDKCTVW